MKHVIIIFIGIVSMFAVPTIGTCGKWAVDVQAARLMYSDENLEAAPAAKVRVLRAYDDYRLYGWIGYQRPRFILSGQSLGYFDIAAAGIGLEKEIFRHFRLWIDGGWFQPIDAFPGKYRDVPGDKGDRFYLYMMSKLCPPLSPHHWDYYQYQISGNAGGSVGLAIDPQLTDRIRLSLLVGWQYLQLTEWMYGRDDAYPAVPDWNLQHSRDFGGPLVGVSIEVSF